MPGSDVERWVASSAGPSWRSDAAGATAVVATAVPLIAVEAPVAGSHRTTRLHGSTGCCFTDSRTTTSAAANRHPPTRRPWGRSTRGSPRRRSDHNSCPSSRTLSCYITRELQLDPTPVNPSYIPTLNAQHYRSTLAIGSPLSFKRHCYVTRSLALLKR